MARSHSRCHGMATTLTAKVTVRPPPINRRSHGTSPPNNYRSHGTSPPYNCRRHGTSPPINCRSHGTSPPINSRSHGTTPTINCRSHDTSPPINCRSHGMSPPINCRSHGKVSPLITPNSVPVISQYMPCGRRAVHKYKTPNVKLISLTSQYSCFQQMTVTNIRPISGRNYELTNVTAIHF
jgi:hypothetical protein